MTFRYAQVALNHWEDLDGYAVGHGLQDPRKLPLDRFCHWVWWMLTRNANEQDKAKTKAKLWRPPKDLEAPIDKRSPWSAENETKAFSALRQQLMPGSVSTAAPGSAARPSS